MSRRREHKAHRPQQWIRRPTLEIILLVLIGALSIPRACCDCASYRSAMPVPTPNGTSQSASRREIRNGLALRLHRPKASTFFCSGREDNFHPNRLWFSRVRSGTVATSCSAHILAELLHFGSDLVVDMLSHLCRKFGLLWLVSFTQQSPGLFQDENIGIDVLHRAGMC
jgi:hypothetical protein